MFEIFCTILYYTGMVTFAIGFIVKIAVMFNWFTVHYDYSKKENYDNSTLAQYLKIINNQ